MLTTNRYRSSNYGNSSSSTIPVCICHNVPNEIKFNIYKCMLSGFGAGLTYSSIIMDIGEFNFCEILITTY